jgi:hypothetical protein
LSSEAGEEQLTDVFIAQAVEVVRPHRSEVPAWRVLDGRDERLRASLEHDGLMVAKVHTLLGCGGVVVPARTLERDCARSCGPRRDGRRLCGCRREPGDELQVEDDGSRRPAFERWIAALIAIELQCRI